MSENYKVIWEIEVSQKEVKSYCNATLHEKLLDIANYIEKTYFKINKWIYLIEYDGKKYTVDLENESIEELNEII